MHDVDLRRLLAVARLTPAQAVALGTDVLAALEDPEAAAGSAVLVGPDGRARVAGSGPAGSHEARLATAAAVLDELRAATDGEAASSLERAAAETRSPEGRLAFAAAILREADAPEGAQARAELSTLVRVLTGVAQPIVAPSPPPRRRTRPRRTRRARARALVARSWKWGLSLVLLVAIVGVEIAFLQDRIAEDVQAVLDAGRSAAAPATPTGLPPVVPPEPAAAGPIDRVDLRPVQPCAPGTACALRTQVVVQPQAGPQTVTWNMRILDRCTGVATTVPGGSVTVPPGGDRADAVGTVALPDAGALAVVAVATAPATAASAPVDIPGNGACAN
ncbi:hypothetical protein [Pseudonocardia zijingensis]|uniref:hypothetical protein n=3 Tax=Pseudonocardia zijingensis TaxID=153376 RepID=UPI00360E920D